MSLGERARAYFETLQETICAGLERADGRGAFREDRWRHTSGNGGGITRVLTGGALLEKAGVNTSAVGGTLSERIAERMKVARGRFYATGVSLVVHPESPMVPTVHMNLRYIEVDADDSAGGRAWFGGGADLTPYYLFREDAVWFHRTWKAVCDRHDPDHYPRFKKWCDEYFRLPHRGEARGVGGVFFDYLQDQLPRTFAFVRDAGDAFLEAYLPIVERRRIEPWGEDERAWQLVRRGRYVEFNLIHDRGTLFGLETGGRTESILMSLPPLVRWPYDHRPESGSRESELLEVLRNPVDWI